MKAIAILMMLAFGMLLFPACGDESDDQKAGQGKAALEQTKKAAMEEAEEAMEEAEEGMEELEAAECAGCAELMKGKTGWCAECGTGFYEGQEVNCKGGCQANPGGPPCEDCVK